ncbi:hypothetical protein [Marinifilum flexuosum]|uniref:Uncharacterized protein n=1 Tax=Marinifilum flexuosum TaxID=1117708 RepID=A0A419X9S6_9BACT|nr:hypothetical protein [Marinifilum flexuosum]RKE04513.1 hypothetical protein BXY64_1539 [Marinifilum flexuosum]
MKLHRLIIVILFFSCAHIAGKRIKKATVYDYQIWISNLDQIELRDSAVLYVDSVSFNNGVSIVYRDSLKSDSSFRYAYSIKGDSLFYFGEYCELKDTVTVGFKDGFIELYKSEYDRKNSADEEAYIYWNSEYGIISVYNYSWGALSLFDYEQIPNFAKVNFYNYIIEEEKKGFSPDSASL